MSKLRVATVFSGIGSFEFALHRLNIPHDVVFACDSGGIEIDYDIDSELQLLNSLKSSTERKEYVDRLFEKSTRKTNFVKKSYLANFDINKERYFQDIRLLNGLDFKGEVDILVGGSPCQSFSSIGFQNGLEDARGTLFYEFARLVDQIQPKVFIYENVRGLLTHDKKNTWNIVKGIFENIDHYEISHQILNSKEYGIPQNRNRLFVVGIKNGFKFEFPKDTKLKYKLDDFRIDNCKYGSFNFDKKGALKINKEKGIVDSKYKLSPSVEKYVLSGGTKGFYQKPEINLRIARPLLATMNNKHRAGIDNYFSFDGGVRMLTERETLRLMGFTDDFKIDVSKAQIYKQAGNSIVVDVFISIIKEMMLQISYLPW